MKEFKISGIHFWCGNSMKNFEVDVSEDAIMQFLENQGKKGEYSKLIKLNTKYNFTMFVIKKATCNNWRKLHGLPMRRMRRD